ncbi:aminoacylase-1 [Eurytemora carolleeae]|uniref:aminoacylase-1 n=1 Tax=Eurytemora carolleeae TaxID=1294199 RepID=UPI000C755AE3|nr:aminoacylase-1 [Eurytemora carolleeae]|eukprot:XP_023331715.1 aminoacylase-1-like [Eurytemora affinis]
MAEHPSTTLFRDYIRIETVQPNPDYPTCMKFLGEQAERLDLPFKIIECVAGKPIFILTWAGTQPDAQSILLNSHTDVVPVYPDSWKHPPFSAFKDENGDIYGRGTQDMKCVGIQHIEAVRQLKESGRRLKRTIHLSFVPDEEIGGLDGMKVFVHTKEFKDLNVGFILDEGIAVPDDTIPVYYGERNVFWIEIICPGSPGHGSRFLENNAALKAQYMINKLMEFRDKEKKRLLDNPQLTLGDVTTVNLTIMEGGVQANVVPEKFKLTFDIRITPTTNIHEFENMIRG